MHELLRPETLPRRRPRIFLPAMLVVVAAIGAQLMLQGGHPLPAVTATVSRWALETPAAAPALARLLGVTEKEVAAMRRMAATGAGPVVVHVALAGRPMVVSVE